MNLSDNLKRIRKENNLSQEQLAEKLGVSRQSVSKWESNQAYPEMDKVLQICQMFNLNIDELLNQNIKEVKEKKESKNNINKYMDDFLNFITKTVDMFSSMKFKQKIRCLFEQCIICLILVLLFLIIGSLGSFIINNLLGMLPYELYSIIYNIFRSLYVLFAIVASIVISLHIFKTRYFDYYVIVKNNKEDASVDNLELINDDILESQEKIYLEKKERIIIRDPKHSGYRFIKGLLRCLLFIIKSFVIFIALGFIVTLMSLTVALVISFLFIKTGILFIGTFISLISAIAINILILYIIYNFILSKKFKINIFALISIISILLFGIGIGLIIIGIKDFDYITDINSKYFTDEEKIISMDDNLLLDDGYYHNFEIEYKEIDSNDIKVVCKHSENYICDINVYNNRIYTHVYQDDTNLMEQLRQIVSDINNKKIIDYSNYKIFVYASKENIEKLENNKIKYIEEQYQRQIQEQENYYEETINNQNEKIEQQEQTIYDLEETITDNKEEIDYLKEIIKEKDQEIENIINE